MIAHVILFQPRPDLSESERRAVIDSLEAAVSGIPAVRGIHIGRRVTHGLPGYEQAMRDRYDYAAILQFDDIEGLKAYLVHPLHAALAQHFTTAASAALAYDYELVTPGGSERRHGPEGEAGDEGEAGENGVGSPQRNGANGDH